MPETRSARARRGRGLTAAGLITVTAATLLMMAWAVLPASAQAETCPEEGKVEVNPGNQDAINALVLPEGTVVCIKGGETLVTVTADGIKTLQQLLGTGQDVSHYTIITTPSPTPPSPTPPSPTTTTTPPGGGGGVPPTTTPPPAPTTTPPPAPTTTPPSIAPTTVTPTTTTRSPSVAPTTVQPNGTAFTGPESVVPIGAIALMLLTSGSGLLWAGSRRKRDQDQDQE
jgi:hypothetical protein